MWAPTAQMTMTGPRTAGAVFVCWLGCPAVLACMLSQLASCQLCGTSVAAALRTEPSYVNQACGAGQGTAGWDSHMVHGVCQACQPFSDGCRNKLRGTNTSSGWNLGEEVSWLQRRTAHLAAEAQVCSRVQHMSHRTRCRSIMPLPACQLVPTLVVRHIAKRGKYGLANVSEEAASDIMPCAASWVCPAVAASHIGSVIPCRCCGRRMHCCMRGRCGHGAASDASPAA